jgi:hypothetical protein
MDINTFIDKVVNGDAAEAKETLTDLLSTRAMEALELKKIEIAQSLYDDGEEQSEEESTETNE